MADDFGGELRKRRLEREENKRSALERNMEPYYATAGLLIVSRADGEDTHEVCGVAAFRPPREHEHSIAIMANHEDVSAAIVLRRDDLRAMLKLVEGKPVKPEKMRELQVGVMDVDELRREEGDG